MNIRPIRIVLAAAIAGTLSLAACDEEGSPGSPGTTDAVRQDRRDDPVRVPGDASRPGEAAHPGDPVHMGDPTRPADNTAHNKGDGADAAKTPFDQAENVADIKVTADIRKAVLGMDGLSTNADNIKIITANGVVAVRGVVESQSELDAITRIVNETPGVSSSDIQLSIDPD